MGGRCLQAAVCALLCGCLTACGRHAVAPVTTLDQTGAPDSSTSASAHVVRKGDTLYSIAWKNGLDYREVAGWNGIGPPYRIYPGQRISLVPSGASRATPSGTGPRPTSGKRIASASPIVPAKQRPPGKARSVNGVDLGQTTDLSWAWPAEGRIVRTFSASEPGKKGLDIAGGAGQSVRAAAGGRVVYSGSGLLGYGNLIIIKHNDTYLSAYAHNRRLLVSEGERVRAGQPIAEMGNTGTNRVMLHFEIRRFGKPVDPLKYLPPRR
jgi:lipoprotein NlpD